MRLTKRFMDWYQGNNDKEKETPKGGVKSSSVSTEPLSFGDLPGRIWFFPGGLLERI